MSSRTWPFVNGWWLHSVAEAGEDNPYEEIWSVDGGTSSVRYIEDGLLGVAYVLTMGERAPGLSTGIAEQLTTLTPDEVLAWAYVVDNPEERVRAIGYLAAAAPDEPSEAFVRVLESLLRDEHVEVRNAALFACAHLSWPQLDPHVRAVRDGDADPGIRGNAARVLDVVHRYRGGQNT